MQTIIRYEIDSSRLRLPEFTISGQSIGCSAQLHGKYVRQLHGQMNRRTISLLHRILKCRDTTRNTAVNLLYDWID